jgi:hypothetical protein
MVDSILVPSQHRSRLSVNRKDIYSFADPSLEIAPSDFILQQLRMNYALGDRNPLELIHFYDTKDYTKKFKIRKDEVEILCV